MSCCYSPIVIFAYNRVDKLKKCLDYLARCPEAPKSELYIFCDGPKGDKDRADVENVQGYAYQYAQGDHFGSVNVTAQENNRGLAASIISGVTEVVNKHGRVIVVEDDLIVLPSFLKYMNEGLEYYADDKKCGSVCSFSYPMKALKNYDKDVYFTRKADCWGWGTWSDRWNNAIWADTDYTGYLSNPGLRWNFERLEAGLDRLMYLQYKGKIDSWAVRWVYYLFCTGQLSVYPTRSQTINSGFDGSGTHISRGFGADFNRSYNESIDDFRWEKCEFNKKLADACAKYPRRFLPLYILETIRFMLKKK